MGKPTLVLTQYDITGKSETEVECEVYNRLFKLVDREDASITGKDTLLHIVAGACLVFAKENVEAVFLYIKEEVHKLFGGD